MQTKKAKRGFTITELVIVIAVIAILAAVLIPTFSNVIQRANESAAMQEARSEWSNFQVEVATNDADSNDFLIVHKEGDDSNATYTGFVVVNGEFDVDGIDFGTTQPTVNGIIAVDVDGTENNSNTTATLASLAGELMNYQIESANIVSIFSLTPSTGEATIPAGN